MVQVINFFNQIITASANWFVTLLAVSGMTDFFLSMFFIFLLGRFILRPLFGSSRGSDKVAKRKDGSNNG